MLVCALDMSPYSTIRHTPDYIQAPSNNIRKYNVNTIPEHFLTQPTVKTAIRTVIQRLEYATIRQADIDGIYSDFVNILHTEMDKSLKYRDIRTSRTVANKHRRRPYWNDNLSMLWNEARTAEKWSQELSDTGDEHNDQEDNTDAGTWNHLLNSRLYIEETIGALHRAKRAKSVGIDNIPNEILKCSGLLHVLHKLFHTCFENNTIPSPWYQSIIHPILKKRQGSSCAV